MKIDFSRYKTFHENWELFRCIYLQNKVPATKNVHLDFGGALHKLIENGWKRVPMDTGMDEFELDSRLKAMDLLPVWTNYTINNPVDMIANEQEFEYQIPDTPHSIIGKTDMIERRHGDTFPGDFKSLDNGTTLEQFEAQWVFNYQAEFNILGHPELDNPDGRFSIYGIRKPWVDKGKKYQKKPLPLDVMRIEVKRSQFELDALIRSVIMTCDTIEFLIDRFGTVDPWVHYVHGMFDGYRCRSGECDWAALCGQSAHNWNLDGFVDREEHLDLLREVTHD